MVAGKARSVDLELVVGILMRIVKEPKDTRSRNALGNGKLVVLT